MSNSPQLHFRILSLICPQTVYRLGISDNGSRTGLVLAIQTGSSLTVELLEVLGDGLLAGDRLTKKGDDAIPIGIELIHLCAEVAGRIAVEVGAVENTEAEPTSLALTSLVDTINQEEALNCGTIDSNGLFLDDDIVLSVRKFDFLVHSDAAAHEGLTSGHEFFLRHVFARACVFAEKGRNLGFLHI